MSLLLVLLGAALALVGFLLASKGDKPSLFWTGISLVLGGLVVVHWGYYLAIVEVFG
jgi:hypothetical protein